MKDDTTFEYAADGAMTRRVRAVGSDVEVTDYEWDGDRRLAAVNQPDGARVEFLYDAWGRRLRKTRITPDGARRDVRFVWDGDVLLHEIVNESSPESSPVVKVRTYVFDDDLVTPLAHQDSTLDDVAAGLPRLDVTDWLGTPVSLLDGAAANDVEIGSFGEGEATRRRTCSGLLWS